MSSCLFSSLFIGYCTSLAISPMAQQLAVKSEPLGIYRIILLLALVSQTLAHRAMLYEARVILRPLLSGCTADCMRCTQQLPVWCTPTNPGPLPLPACQTPREYLNSCTTAAAAYQHSNYQVRANADCVCNSTILCRLVPSSGMLRYGF